MRERAGIMQLESTLEQFSLSELIAMMADSSVTGMLEVGIAPPLGRLFCAHGRLYHAETENCTGVAALRAIVEADAAPFRFITGPYCTEKTLDEQTEVLIGLVKRAERLRTLMRRHVHDLTWVPELCSSGPSKVCLHPALWPVLATIDGQRSVVEVANRLGRDLLEVGALLSELIERGLVTLGPRQRAVGAPSLPPVTFFDRLMGGQLARKPATQAAPVTEPAFVSRLRLRAS